MEKPKRKSSVPPSPHYKRILQALHETVPMTTRELALFLSVKEELVRHHIRVMRAEGKNIYIHEWKVNEGKIHLAPVYAFKYGLVDKLDKFKPLPMTRKEQKDRYYQKNKLRIALTRNGSRSKFVRLNNPFGMFNVIVNKDTEKSNDTTI